MDTPEFGCGEAAEAVEKLIRYQIRNMDLQPQRRMCQQVRPHLLLAHSSTDVRCYKTQKEEILEAWTVFYTRKNKKKETHDNILYDSLL